MDKVGARVKDALLASLADSTRDAQRVAMRLWVKFCFIVMGVSPVRGSAANGVHQTAEECLHDEWLLMYFAVMTAAQTSPGTAATYVSHVKTWHQLYRGIDLGPLAGCLRLSRCIAGLRKLSKHAPKHHKLPILLSHLERWERVLRPGSHDDRAFKAAAYAALQGLLRVSEYTVKSGDWDPARHLSRADLVFSPSIENPSYAALNIGPTKNDPLGEDRCPVLFAFDATAPINACSALRDMVLADPVPIAHLHSTPLFRWRDGSAMRAAQMVRCVQRCMKAIGECPLRYASHSLRIGGATSLADAGCPDVVIQTIGRWKSNCYRIYCRAAQGSVLHWCRTLGTHHVQPVHL